MIESRQSYCHKHRVPFFAPPCIYAKNYENWPAVDKVIAKITRLTFWPTL